MSRVSDLYEGIVQIDEDGYYVYEDGNEVFYKHDDDSDTYALYKAGSDITEGVDPSCTYDGVRFHDGVAYAIVITDVSTEHVEIPE